jgi:hypothetical protein
MFYFILYNDNILKLLCQELTYKIYLIFLHISLSGFVKKSSTTRSRVGGGRRVYSKSSKSDKKDYMSRQKKNKNKKRWMGIKLQNIF